MAMHSRDKIFLLLSSIFISSLIIANLIGITKFVNIYGLSIPVGMLSYPVTFLCTDLISELYGRKHANFLVWVGLLMNVFLVTLVTLGYFLPADAGWLKSIKGDVVALGTFNNVYSLMARATIASMVAYLIAQFCDVYFYHFFKRITNNKHLWLRNNASTMTSQLIDTLAVMFITFYGKLPISEIMTFVLFGYLFKVIAAALDTPFMYLGVRILKPKVELDNA